MNTTKRANDRMAFTLVEMLIVIAIISLLVALLLPALFKAKQRAKSTACMNNLRQMSFGLHSWATDNQDVYPWRVPTNSGGTKGVFLAWAQYLAVSNHISTPQIARCPSDGSRQTATDFSTNETGLRTLTNNAVTYFLGLEASQKFPQSILAGDRAIGVSGNCVIVGAPNITVLRSNASWDTTVHGDSGNTALEDGSIQHLNTERFRRQIESVTEPNYNSCAM